MFETQPVAENHTHHIGNCLEERGEAGGSSQQYALKASAPTPGVALLGKTLMRSYLTSPLKRDLRQSHYSCFSSVKDFFFF